MDINISEISAMMTIIISVIINIIMLNITLEEYPYKHKMLRYINNIPFVVLLLFHTMLPIVIYFSLFWLFS